jgi:4-amino-4-deoxy-L-arabinose transferase-like glycosyltransferase
MSERTRTLCELLLALWAVAFSALYAFTNPPFEAPDEPAHLRNVNFYAAERRIPNVRNPEEDTKQAHQHPLYYAIAGAAVIATQPDDEVGFELEPNPYFVPVTGTERAQPKYVEGPDTFRPAGDRATFLFLRLVNGIFAGLTVLAIARAARLVLNGPVWLAAPALAAFLPQFQFISSSVSNDPLTALLCSLAFWAGAAAWKSPERAAAWIALGVCLALAFLAKKSGLVLLPAAIALGMVVETGGKSSLRWGRLAMILLPLALAAIPVMARNYGLYGEWLTNALEEEVGAGHLHKRTLFDPYFGTSFLKMTAVSFVGHFGWMSVPLSSAWTFGAAGLLILAVVGSLLRLPEGGRAVLIILWLALLGNLAGHVFYNLSFTQPQGRYLFPVLAAIAILFAMGLQNLAARAPFLRHPAAVWIGIGLALALDVAAWLCNRDFYLSAA